MRPLSDTLLRLAAFKDFSGSMGGAAAPDRLSDMVGFGSNPGALRARTYIPVALPRQAPLVVVLHGCTQTAAGYDHGAGWSVLADQLGFALLFPEQQRGNNANLCFNWFEPDDTRRDAGEALSIRQMIEAVVRDKGLDQRRVFITGLSAGGAMAAAMLATYPEVFAGGAVIAGVAYGCAASVPQAFDRMRGHGLPDRATLEAAVRAASDHRGAWPTLSVWQGSADRTVSAANADALVAQWQGILGVRPAPAVTTIRGQRRTAWRNADGREVIERYEIAGMGHGTPVDPKGGVGVAGPFMLDVGLSSTARIAAFWQLGEIIDAPQVAPEDGRFRAASGPASIVTGIKETVENALRKAGLMR